MFSVDNILDVLSSPIVAFILLLLITHLVYLKYFTTKVPSIASGSILMAIAAFSLDSLQQLGFPYFLLLYVALEVLIIGLYLGLCLIQNILEDEINLQKLSHDLTLGTWIVGIALTVLLLNQVDRTLIGFVALLSVIAFSMFAYYVLIVFAWLRANVLKSAQLQATGIVLIPALSIQAMTLLLSELFHEELPSIVYQIIICSGLVMYVIGILSMMRYFLAARKHHIVLSWVNENTLIHGVLSLTGIAMINALNFPDWSIYYLWYITFALFLALAILSCLRLLARFQYKTYNKAVGIYHNSQWFRVFSFAAFYTFSISAYEYEYSDDILISFIASYGQYIVALIMLAQIILLVRYISQKEMAK